MYTLLVSYLLSAESLLQSLFLGDFWYLNNDELDDKKVILYCILLPYQLLAVNIKLWLNF